MAWQPEDSQEIQCAFRSPTSCASLHGETWTASDLFGPGGTVSGAQNAIFYRAREAMRDRMEQQVQRNQQPKEEVK